MERELRDLQKLLSLQEVSKRFGKAIVLSDVSWSIARGECVAITGGNGAGKSTLLCLIAGLANPSSGARREHIKPLIIGYVSDRFPPLRFRPSEYLRYLARIQGIAKEAAVRRIDAMMNIFQLPDTMMNLCSKGMLQKVNVMQALLRQPDLLVLDEPLSGLDEPSQLEMIGMLNEIKRQGTSIVMSVHEPLLIASLADRVTVVEGGTITQDGLLAQREEAARMRLEFSRVRPDVMQQLESRQGFLYWISRGSPAVMVVAQPFTDEMLVEILRSGGTISRLEPQGKVHSESDLSGYDDVPGRGA